MCNIGQCEHCGDFFLYTTTDEFKPLGIITCTTCGSKYFVTPLMPPELFIDWDKKFNPIIKHSVMKY